MKKISLVLAALLALTFSAQAQIVSSLPFTLQNGQTADATQVMADFNAIVDDVNDNAATNGVNNDITSLIGLTTPIPISGGGSSVYTVATVTGTANAIVLATPVPTGFTLAKGKSLLFVAGSTNTGATTIDANSTGATAVVKLVPGGTAALTGGEIVSGKLVEAVYDGTQYTLITNNLSLLGAQTVLASNTTTDLGTITTHNVSISGTTTITAFGSTATTDFPFYYLAFEGALTLTYNAASLILPTSTTITTAAGDYALALYRGSGNWTVLNYVRKTGVPLRLVAGSAGVQGDIVYYSATGVTALLSAGTSGQFLKTQGAAANPIWASTTAQDYQAFTASGTWTKPSGITANAMTTAMCWGGGASGGRGSTGNQGGGGGGGGSRISNTFLTSALGSTETVTIGAGGVAVSGVSTVGNVGGNTTFGSQLTAYGGGGGGADSTGTMGGGGGGGALAVGSVGSTDGGAGGGPAGGAGGTASAVGTPTDGVGGAGGGDLTVAGGASAQGGAGGGGGGTAGTAGAGGAAVYGGAGGGGAGTSAASAGGVSIYGGSGGAGSIDATPGVAGSAPGGGGGGSEGAASGAGARGECRVWTTG